MGGFSVGKNGLVPVEWTTLAHLQEHTGQIHAARQNYERTIGLTSNPALREFLRQHQQQLVPSEAQ